MGNAGTKQKPNLAVLRDAPLVEHPRGTTTAKTDDAYGWHYKKEAEAHARTVNGSVVRRCEVAGARS